MAVPTLLKRTLLENFYVHRYIVLIFCVSKCILYTYTCNFSDSVYFPKCIITITHSKTYHYNNTDIHFYFTLASKYIFNFFYIDIY